MQYTVFKRGGALGQRVCKHLFFENDLEAQPQNWAPIPLIVIEAVLRRRVLERGSVLRQPIGQYKAFLNILGVSEGMVCEVTVSPISSALQSF